MRLDLHCHSTYSDGSEPASEVAQTAIDGGVELFCLTDHDTCAGYEETVAAAAGTRVRVLRGVELSCHEDGRSAHVLLYDVVGGDGWSVVQDALVEQGAARRGRLREMAARLEQLRVPIDIDLILDSSEGRSVGRPHLAQALVAAGHVKNTGEAFRRYLHDGGPADVSVRRLTVEDGLDLARAAGARASLAHPETLGRLTMPLLRRCRELGLDGVEGWYGAYSKRERNRWRRAAAELDLVVTAGSDFHGAMMPRIAAPGIDVPSEIAEPLLRWLEA